LTRGKLEGGSMRGKVALALAVPVALLAGLAFGPGHVRAGEKDKGDKKIEKRLRVFGVGGGPFLGVGLEDVEGDVRGAKVRSVESGSAAEKAGIKEGDVIVSFDGETVRSASQLARLVRETPPGRSVAIEVSRGGANQKLTATLQEGGRRLHIGPGDFELEVPEPPEPPTPPKAPLVPMPHAWSGKGDGRDFVFGFGLGGWRKLGIEYTEIGEQLAGYFKLGEKRGVLVTSVDADGPAAKAGMKAGDVILRLDGTKIEDGDDLRDAVADAEGGQEVAVTVQRDGRPLDLKVTLAKPPERKIRRRSDTT
jgi:serine protease Do